MTRFHQSLLIVSAFVGSWFGMQALHESGHVLAAVLTGGRVAKVVLNPLTISRTDLAQNPHPLIVAWSGPFAGVLLPGLLYGGAVGLRLVGAFVLRFFAGFCCIVNGAYIGVGSFEGIGDAGEMTRHGSMIWQLWLFGAVLIPIGLRLWHRQGRHFGLGDARGEVMPSVAWVTLAAAILMLLVGFLVDGA